MSFKKTLFPVVLMATLIAYADEPAKEKKGIDLVAGIRNFINEFRQDDVIERVVYGDLFRVPHTPYRGKTKEMSLNSQEWVMENVPATDTLIQVCATSKNYPDSLIIDLTEAERNDQKGSCNWADHGHPQLHEFPYYLPLTLFIDESGTLKKDGDIVTLLHRHPETHKLIKVVLTLNQKGYRYAHGGFDECLEASTAYEKLVKPYLKKKNEQ